VAGEVVSSDFFARDTVEDASAMKRPQEIKLSCEAGVALIERLAGDALTVDDQRVLV